MLWQAGCSEIRVKKRTEVKRLMTAGRQALIHKKSAALCCRELFLPSFYYISIVCITYILFRKDPDVVGSIACGNLHSASSEAPEPVVACFFVAFRV